MLNGVLALLFFLP